MSTFRPRYRPSRRALLQGAGAFAVGLTFLPRFSLSAEEKKLNFFNWDTYIGENTLSNFNDATGIEVKMDLYADNDELFAKLKGGNPGYDVIVPTNDTLERMIKAGMVIELDHSKIPNMANIDKPFQDAAFDPGRKYSMPYMWGTLGIGYRKSAVAAAPDSWKVLFDSDEYAGAISLLVTLVEALGADTLVHGSIEGTTMIARLPAATHVAEGKLPLCAEMCSTKALLAGDGDIIAQIYRERVQQRGYGSGAWGWRTAYRIEVRS